MVFGGQNRQNDDKFSILAAMIVKHDYLIYKNECVFPVYLEEYRLLFILKFQIGEVPRPHILHYLLL